MSLSKRPTMHQTLRKREILYRIFAFARSDALCDGTGNAVVATAARVCKSWTYPALDILWRELDSLLPLINICHELQLRIRTTGAVVALIRASPNSHDLESGKIIPDRHWATFQRYARRIRSLKLGSSRVGGSSEVELFIIQFITRNGGPFLPCLLELDITINFPGDNVAAMLVCSSLRKLTLRGSCSQNDSFWHSWLMYDFLTADTMRDIASKVPQLRILVLEELPDDCVRTFTELPDLRRLEVVHYRESLPPLPDTTLGRVVSPRFDYLRAADNVRHFTTLRSVSVDGDHIAVWEALRGMRSTELWEVSVHYCGALVSLNSILELFPAQFPALMKLTLAIDLNDPPSLGLLIPVSQYLNPLLQVQSLEDVDISFGTTGQLNLTNRDIQAFAECWPKLRLLHLRGAPSDFVEYSIDSLLHFARSCPDLDSLCLPSPNTIVPFKWMDDIPYPMLNHGLRHLTFHESFPLSVCDHHQVALFLYSVFPHLDVRLDRVRLSDPPSPDIDNWKSPLLMPFSPFELGHCKSPLLIPFSPFELGHCNHWGKVLSILDVLQATQEQQIVRTLTKDLARVKVEDGISLPVSQHRL
ncbi:hypothetical protein OBBRIDRAFT_272607 [Obba rivulosa]|uniref:F-box domain-containing protein n=1 Tax=Obba rivulosa TaxID=1052685 RepID=A0A8E2DHJ6_9APHY|nr:hypothetical protein OBBRIDRAFT_272607 [Obba rivulosa]